MIVDCHMHTPLCGHAHGMPQEYVRAAANKQLDLITFTCHIPMDNPGFGDRSIRMQEAQLPEYFELIEDAAKLGEKLGVEVLCGIEAEVYPDARELKSMDRILAAHRFDFILGSLHHQVDICRERLLEIGLKRDEDIIRDYFKNLAEGAASGRYHSMSHPDVIRIYGTVGAFEPADFEAEIFAFLEAAKTSDTCIEVNTSGLFKGVYKVHPDPLILRWALENGNRLTLGSDAHQPDRVAGAFDTVIPLLKEIGFDRVHFFRGGERHEAKLPEQFPVSGVLHT